MTSLNSVHHKPRNHYSVSLVFVPFVHAPSGWDIAPPTRPAWPPDHRRWGAFKVRYVSGCMQKPDRRAACLLDSASDPSPALAPHTPRESGTLTSEPCPAKLDASALEAILSDTTRTAFPRGGTASHSSLPLPQPCFHCPAARMRIRCISKIACCAHVLVCLLCPGHRGWSKGPSGQLRCHEPPCCQGSGHREWSEVRAVSCERACAFQHISRAASTL